MKKKFYKKANKPNRVKVQKKATTVVYDKVTEDILAKEQANLEINRRARIDGAKGLPQHDQAQTSSAELEIKSKFERFLRDSLRRIGLVITNLEEEMASVRRIHEMFDLDPKRALKEVLKEGNGQLDQELEAINEEVENKVAVLMREKDRLNLERDKDIIEKNQTEDKIGHRPRKKTWSAIISYAAILVIGVLADLSVTYRNMEKAAETTPVFSMVIAFSAAACIAVAAHLFGRFIKTRDYKASIAAFSGALAFLSFIGLLASNYGSWIMLLMNLAMFIIISLASYVYTHKDARLVKKYFDDEAAIKALEKKLKKIDAEIIHLRSQANQKLLKLSKDHEALINQKIAEHQARTIEDYNAISQELKEFEAYRANVKERFMALYNQQVFQYRNLNQDERRDRGIPLVKMWENNYVEPLLLSSGEASSTPGHSASASTNNGPASKPGSNGLAILLLASTLGFTSCDFFEPPADANVRAIIMPDVTDELAFDPEVTASWLLFDVVGLDTSSSFKPGISVSVSCLNDRYTNRTWAARLPTGGSGFTEITQERIALQRVFRNEVTEVLRQGHNFTGERPRSKLYRPICEAMHELQQSPAQRMIGVIFSDMLENTKHLSFYSYRQNPGKLLEARDSIIEKLEAQCALPDLTGIELYIIHQPTLELDELFDAARQFWRSYFEEKGATVYFLAGI